MRSTWSARSTTFPNGSLSISMGSRSATASTSIRFRSPKAPAPRSMSATLRLPRSARLRRSAKRPRPQRLLLRPQTFMNDSGDSVLAAMSFYKIAPEEIVVIHDELDLRPGKVRVKRGGGSAGHNGLRSIDAMIGPDYWRVRIGIGHPGIKELVHPYVLQNFTPDEARLIVMPLLDAVTETFPLLVEGAPDAFMSVVARRFTPPDLDAEEQE